MYAVCVFADLEYVFFVKVPEFRFVETEKGLQGNPYQQYAMPQDFVDLATGMDPNKLMDFLQLVSSNRCFI